MNNAIATAMFLSIPLVVCTICVSGWLKRRLYYLIVGIVLYILAAGLILAASIASALARGYGSTKHSDWDDLTAFYVSVVFGLIVLIIGFFVRKPHRREVSNAQHSDVKLKTLREKQDEIQKLG